jgi:Pectate lyase superfamily protein
MARLLGPAPDSRLVYGQSSGWLRSGASLTATVYAASTGSTLADIRTYDGTETVGAAISGSTLTVNADSLLPQFWFPDSVDTVWVSVNGGTRTAVYADTDRRVDALAADVALKAPIASPSFTGTVSGVTKAMVGLGNADDTSDANKPISTAQAAALAVKVDEGSLAVNLRDLGAGTTGGTVNDRAIIQAAIDALPSTGGALYFQPGYIYRVDTPLTLRSNVTFEGAGLGSRLHCTAGMFAVTSTLSKIFFEKLYLSGASGHVFETSGGGGISQCVFTKCTITQASASHSLFKHSGAGPWLENKFVECDLWMSGSATVPAIDIDGTAGNLATNAFVACRVNGQGNTAVPFMDIHEASATYVYDWKLKDINVEQCGAGLLKAYGAQGWDLNGIYGWDQASYADDIVYFGRSSTNVKSRRISVRRVLRRGGTLAGGKFDVNLDPNNMDAFSGCELVNISTSTATEAAVQYPAGTYVNLAGDTTTRIPGQLVSTVSTFDSMEPLASGGEGLFNRQAATSSGQASSGQLVLVFARAMKSETITKLAAYTHSTAGSGNTLVRMAVYEQDLTTGDLTLVASTANDTSLFTAGQTRYEKALSASWSKVAGRRYAVGVLVVDGTIPAFVSMAANSVAVHDAIYGTGGALGRRTCTVNSLSDLPATIDDALFVNTRRSLYIEMLP